MPTSRSIRQGLYGVRIMLLKTDPGFLSGPVLEEMATYCGDKIYFVKRCNRTRNPNCKKNGGKVLPAGYTAKNIIALWIRAYSHHGRWHKYIHINPEKFTRSTTVTCVDQKKFSVTWALLKITTGNLTFNNLIEKKRVPLHISFGRRFCLKSNGKVTRH